jgi:hypothetical protein
MRGSYQEMAAKGLITFKELEDELQALEKTRKTAERELQAPYETTGDGWERWNGTRILF